jgi:uncharacterized RDD family membrane protein YckC
VGAAVIDWLILLIPTAVLVGGGVALALDGSGAAEVIGWVVAGVAYLGALALYAPLLMMREGAHNGQTWGRQIMGIRVVRDNGTPIGFGFAFVREAIVKWLLFQVAGGTFFLPTVLDFLWPLWDGENRALHDFVCSTHVVKA